MCGVLRAVGLQRSGAGSVDLEAVLPAVERMDRHGGGAGGGMHLVKAVEGIEKARRSSKRAVHGQGKTVERQWKVKEGP